MKKMFFALLIILFAAAAFTLTGEVRNPTSNTAPSTTLTDGAPMTDIFQANSDSCSAHTVARKCNSSKADDGRNCCWKGSEEHPRGGECGVCKTR